VQGATSVQYIKSVRAGCVGKQFGGKRKEEVREKSMSITDGPQEMNTTMVQPIEILSLTSRVAKDRKSGSEHDENGEADAEKGGVCCGRSTTLTIGAVPTCQRVSPCSQKGRRSRRLTGRNRGIRLRGIKSKLTCLVRLQ
jgi:hypothetical protein